MEKVRWIKGLAVVWAALLSGISSPASASPAISSQNFGSVAANSSNTLTFQVSGLSSPRSFGLQYGVEFSFVQSSCTFGTPATCTLTVKFQPVRPGLRQDGIQVLGNNGTLLAIVLLYGVGQAPVAVLRPGIITSFAGTGTLGNSGDNGPAVNAELSNPQGLAIDTAGNVYIADSLAQVVRKVDTTGNITTVAGNPAATYPGDGGPATSAGLNAPVGLSVDGAGNLYIADSQNNRVRRVDALTSIITTVAGTGAASTNLGDGNLATAASLNNPVDVAVDPAGNLYIADQGNNRIRRVDARTGIITTVAGGGTAAGLDGLGDGAPAVNASLSQPAGLAFDASGNLYIADKGNKLIREVSNGVISTVAGTSLQGPLNGPSGIRVDAAGNLYITDTNTNNSLVWQVNGAGTMSVLAGQQDRWGFNGNGIPADLAYLNSPAAIALDPSGNIYIADQGNSMVRKIIPGPTALSFPSTSVGTISPPQALSIDNIGNQPLSFSAFGFTGSFVQQSSGTEDCSLETTLPAASSCSVAIAFAPQTPGSSAGLFSWQTNAQTATLTLPLTGAGTGIANSDPTVNETTLSFSNQTAGTASAAQIVTLTNSSTATLSAPGFTISGSNALDFSKSTTTCQSTLAPNASCTVSVVFTPGAAGARSATLSLIETNTATNTQLNQTVFLQGAATDPPLTVTPSIQFGNQAVNTPSPTQTVTLTNSSSVNVPVASIFLNGPSDFSISNNSCGSVVSANSSCTVTLVFTPTIVGQEQGTLQFTDGAANSPQSVILEGTGVGVLQLLGASSTVNLGTTVLGGAPVLNMTFSNPGPANYSISAITVGGANATEFTFSNGCGAVVASGSSCTVAVTFRPVSLGIRVASLTIAGPGLEAPVTVGLTGTAIAQIPFGGAKPAYIRAAGDYDGDGKTDFAVWRPSTGTWYVLLSGHPGSVLVQQWGWPTDIPVPGDYDGDGKTDFAVWRPSTGTWYVLPSGHPGSVLVQQWGWPTDIPVPGDYNGDGKIDFAVWRPSTSTWYALTSTSILVQQWGWPTDIPVPGDYDGDGKTDFAVWRPSTGTWYALTSTSILAQQWGWPTDIPVPGDYNGDGKTDFAVWRPSTGAWYALTSTSILAQQWGWATDIPVPGDYNGDGKTDFAVWRPSSGNWYALTSTSVVAQQWGWPTDLPR
jgi:hypothetical protein